MIIPKRLFSSHPTQLLSSEIRKKVTIDSIRKMYRSNVPISMMTAHDYPSGYFTDQAGIDITLIGDSLAMVALGLDSTNKITLDVFFVD